MSDELTNLANAIAAIPEPDPAADLDTTGTYWTTLDTLAKELSVIVRDWANQTGALLTAADYKKKDGYELPTGVRIHHDTPSRDKWEGRRLLGAISTDMIDPTSGEVVAGIPLRVLCDIIPGVGSDTSTSSRWLMGGLRNIDVDPDDYRTREWLPPIARTGVGR